MAAWPRACGPDDCGISPPMRMTFDPGMYIAAAASASWDDDGKRYRVPRLWLWLNIYKKN